MSPLYGVWGIVVELNLNTVIYSETEEMMEGLFLLGDISVGSQL